MDLNPWSWGEHILRVLTALGTTAAVTLLLFLEVTKGALRSWRAWRRRPELSLTHNAESDLAREVIGNVTQTTPAAYVRLGVENAAGRRAAPAVEVTMKQVEQLDGDRAPSLPTHNMGPLGWTYRDPLLNQLGPGVRRTATARPGTFGGCPATA